MLYSATSNRDGSSAGFPPANVPHNDSTSVGVISYPSSSGYPSVRHCSTRRSRNITQLTYPTSLALAMVLLQLQPTRIDKAQGHIAARQITACGLETYHDFIKSTKRLEHSMRGFPLHSSTELQYHSMAGSRLCALLTIHAIIMERPLQTQ